MVDEGTSAVERGLRGLNRVDKQRFNKVKRTKGDQPRVWFLCAVRECPCALEGVIKAPVIPRGNDAHQERLRQAELQLSIT